MPTWKRAMDLAACVVALPFLALGTLIMTIVTRLVSPGPVFFRQERVGLGGRRFYLYKFRTMKVNAATAGHELYYKQLMASCTPMQKLDGKGDSRLIPFGWFLRALGLDELPQIINVLRGEMSLIGPRPCLPYEYEAYTSWQNHRLDATPGLTGLWQVSGKNRTTFDQMVAFDIEYARNFSLWLDLKIVFLTMPALIRQLNDTRCARKAERAGKPAQTSLFQSKQREHQLNSS